MKSNLAHSHDDHGTTAHKRDSGLDNFWRRLRGKAVPPIQYFLPGQVLLQVSHPDNLSADEVAEAMGKFLNPQSDKAIPAKAQVNARQVRHTNTAKHSEEGDSWRNRLQPPDSKSMTRIPSTARSGIVSSIVPSIMRDAEKHHTNNAALIEVLLSSYKESEGKAIPIDEDKRITLDSVSPNWIMSAAYHGCATGGPGGWPVQAHEPEGDDWKFYKAQDQNGVASNELLSKGHGAGVHVVILDTAPTRHALETAYEEWHWGHPLIERLLKTKDDPLHLYPADNADLSLTAELSLLGHRYWMRDHGLFVAGIIHSIAPKATLHLYETLNPYGVASIENIAISLVKILADKEIKRPLIINCSFMLGIPVGGVLDEDFPPEIRNQAGFLDYLIKTPRELFEWVVQQNEVYVIAAAGNDGEHNNSSILIRKRPSTRYPAAFKGVWGVGALPKNDALQNGSYRAATYSNLADNTVPPEGYVTLGGEPGVGRGVLGVYIGDFPAFKAKGCFSILWQLLGLNIPRPGRLPKWFRALMPEDIEYKRNTTGWAWWAGTSFATPIVTGKVAADYSVNPGDVTQILADASRQSVVANPAGSLPTREGEPVILAAQRLKNS